MLWIATSSMVRLWVILPCSFSSSLIMVVDRRLLTVTHHPLLGRILGFHLLPALLAAMLITYWGFLILKVDYHCWSAKQKLFFKVYDSRKELLLPCILIKVGLHSPVHQRYTHLSTVRKEHLHKKGEGVRIKLQLGYNIPNIRMQGSFSPMYQKW
jgi:hypothetical protein